MSLKGHGILLAHWLKIIENWRIKSKLRGKNGLRLGSLIFSKPKAIINLFVRLFSIITPYLFHLKYSWNFLENSCTFIFDKAYRQSLVALLFLYVKYVHIYAMRRSNSHFLIISVFFILGVCLYILSFHRKLYDEHLKEIQSSASDFKFKLNKWINCYVKSIVWK